MGSTDRLNIPYPEQSDQNNVPVDFEEALDVIDANILIPLQGLYADRPAAGVGRRQYWATDVKQLYYDDGTAWREVTRSSAWLPWTPTFTPNDGAGNAVPTTNVNVQSAECRYRLVANGTQCEIFYRSTIAFAGAGPEFFGLWISLPVLPTKVWILDADCNNDLARAVSDPGGGGRISIFPKSGGPSWPRDNFHRAFGITGVYEVAAQEGVTIPDEEEGGSVAPSGPAGGDLQGTYPNPTIKSTAFSAKSLSVFQPPTANLPMNNKKTTGQAKGTSNTDGATMENIGDHNSDDAAHPGFLKSPNGGRNFYVATSSVEANVLNGEVQFLDDKIQKRKDGGWLTISQSATQAPGENTDPTTPGSGTDVDRRADTMSAIDQWFEEFVNSDGWAIDSDLGGGNKVTSSSMAYGLLFSVMQGNQARFDLIRDKANAVLARKVNSETFAPNLWARGYTVGTGVTDWNSHYGAEYVRADALLRACQLWNRQKDYDDASLLATDLEACTANIDEDRMYQVTDNTQKTVANGHHTVGGASVWEMAPGQLNPSAHRKLRAFTARPVWDKFIAGDYATYSKVTDNAGGVPTSVGLFPDFASYRTDTHDLAELLNGTSGWTVSKSRNYAAEAMMAIVRLYIEWKIYGDTRARDLLSGPLKAWAIGRWGTTNKFVIAHQHSDGTELSTSRKLPFAYAGYFAMIANDPANATAANVKATWLTGTMATNSDGDYFKSDPPDVAASSTFAGNSLMILLESIDNGLYAELSEIPGVAGKYNAAADPGTTPGGGTSVPTTPLPTGSVKLAVNRSNLAGVYAAALPNGTTNEQKKKSRFMRLREVPQSVWTGPEWDANGAVTQAYMAMADAQGGWFQLTMYGIPNRDLGGASAGGSAGAVEYRAWTDAVISKIGNRFGVVIIEPDSIAMILGQPQAEFDARCALIRELVVKLRNQCPNARIYLDAAHAAWFPDPGPLMDGLIKAGVALCHGFISNVSNFRTEAHCISWSENLWSRLNIPVPFGYLFDAGRNGAEPAPDGADWQNPLQTKFGKQPQFGGVISTNAPNCHGRLWVKNPGESDGNNDSQGRGDHGGPAAGQLFPLWLYNEVAGVPVADNANGSTAGDISGSGNAGPLQRPAFFLPEVPFS